MTFGFVISILTTEVNILLTAGLLVLFYIVVNQTSSFLKHGRYTNLLYSFSFAKIRIHSWTTVCMICHTWISTNMGILVCQILQEAVGRQKSVAVSALGITL